MKVTMKKVLLNEKLKELFKWLYTLAQFLYITDISPKNELLEEKIKELENGIKEKYIKTPELKIHLEKLREEKTEFDRVSTKGGNVDEEQAEKIRTLVELRIFKAIDYVLIAKDLIIDKMNALIELLESKEDVTYEKVIDHLNKILKAKSTVAEVGDIKNQLKNRLLVKILKKSGKIKESTLGKILDNAQNLQKKFKEVLAPERIFEEEKQKEADAQKETRRLTEEQLMKWKMEADAKRDMKLKEELEKNLKQKEMIKAGKQEETKKRNDEFYDSDVDE